MGLADPGFPGIFQKDYQDPPLVQALKWTQWHAEGIYRRAQEDVFVAEEVMNICQWLRFTKSLRYVGVTPQYVSYSMHPATEPLSFSKVELVVNPGEPIEPQVRAFVVEHMLPTFRKERP